MSKVSYRQLDPGKIVATVETLHARIRDRFPSAGLAHLAEELFEVAKATVARAARVQRANHLLRATALAFFVAIPIALYLLEVETVRTGDQIGIETVPEFIQTLEALLGAIVFLGAAVFFVFSLETRIKRRRTLAALHELRSMAHIVDMHQLTKDPERLDPDWQPAATSPVLAMTAFELARYLDYCSEMLALISKVAALWIQRFPDTAAVTAVDELENLTNGLSRKIWQKIMLLDRLQSSQAAGEGQS
jgi:hypothetical protein